MNTSAHLPENIMTPASMITYIDDRMNREEITETIKHSIHRTFPVYDIFQQLRSEKSIITG